MFLHPIAITLLRRIADSLNNMLFISLRTNRSTYLSRIYLRNEKQALLDLQSDTSVLTRPADKGGLVVLMERTVYVNECHRQLIDKTFYKRLRSDPTSQFQNTILSVLDGYLSSGQIAKKACSFLVIFNTLKLPLSILCRNYTRMLHNLQGALL